MNVLFVCTGSSCRSVTGLGDREIDDPIGQPEEVYRTTRDLIETGLEALLKRDAYAKP